MFQEQRKAVQQSHHHHKLWSVIIFAIIIWYCKALSSIIDGSHVYRVILRVDEYTILLDKTSFTYKCLFMSLVTKKYTCILLTIAIYWVKQTHDNCNVRKKSCIMFILFNHVLDKPFTIMYIVPRKAVYYTIVYWPCMSCPDVMIYYLYQLAVMPICIDWVVCPIMQRFYEQIYYGWMGLISMVNLWLCD